MSGQIDFSHEGILQDGILPGDLIVSILANLPVKSLLKFKVVCKPWYSLISSPNFIKMHLYRQSVTANNLLLSVDDLVDEQDCKFGLVTPNFHVNYDRDVMILENPPSLSKHAFIVDSCNGLVCLYSPKFLQPVSLILWNPATRKCRSLELSDMDGQLSIDSVGLCYVEATNDYKIVGWTTITAPVVRQYMFIYSMSSDSCEKLNYDAQKFRDVIGSPTFLNGCMHWSVNKHTCMIMAFDVTDGVMSSLAIPDNCGCRSVTLKRKTLVIRGCLSIAIFSECEVVESGMEIWTMIDYGVEGSWVKQFTIQGLTLVVPLISLQTQEDEIVFMNEKDVSNILMFYDPFTKKQNYLEFKSLFIYQVFNYVESLVSVGEEIVATFSTS